MKSFILFVGIGITGLTLFPGEEKLTSEIRPKSSPPYHWKRVLAPGTGSFEDQWTEGKWPMGIVPVIAFGNELWMIGQKKSWSSGNGIDWTPYPKADWGERHGMAFVFFRDKLWMSGGMKSWGDFRNDIWVSIDGKNWERVVHHASWPERVRHKMVVFKNRLWLIGGTISSGDAKKLPAESYNDIWSSDDGISWTLQLKEAPWPARHDPKVVVFNDKLWLIGGVDQVGGTGMQDVWNSADGMHWTLVTTTAPWEGRRNNGLIVFDKKLWLFGGVEKNDAWYSTDGAQWQQLQEHAPWSTRTAESSVAFKNKLWIYSGKTGREDSWSGEVWTLSK